MQLLIVFLMIANYNQQMRKLQQIVAFRARKKPFFVKSRLKKLSNGYLSFLLVIIFIKLIPLLL